MDAASQETQPHGLRRWALIERVLVALAGVGCALLFWDYVKDDTYISFRYARNLVDGHGLVFNPGERVEGYTNFSWVLWSALPHWIGQNGDVALLWARLLSLVSVVALGWSTRSLSHRLIGANDSTAHWMALAAALAVVTHPTVAIYAMSGLETVFFAALCTACIERSLAGHARSAAWWAALACLTRPEGHLFALVALGVFLWRARPQQDESTPLQALFRRVWLPMALVCGYHVWRILYFGELMPNTHHVKNGQGSFLYAGVQDLAAAYEITSFAVITVAGLFGALLLRQVRLVGCVALALVFPVYLLWAGGDEMHYGRLLLPAVPLFAAVGIVGIHRVATHPWGGRARARVSRAVGVLACVGAVAMSCPDLSTLHGEVQGWHEGMKAAQGALGSDLSATLPKEAQVVYQDMGYCPYTASSLRFFDTVGLVNGPLTKLRREEGVLMQGVRPRADEDTGSVYQRYRGRVRDLVFAEEPEAIVFVVAVQNIDGSIPTEPWSRLADYLAHGTSFGFSAGLQRDPRLTEGYTFFRAYVRTPGVHLVALLRRDLNP